MKQDPSLPPEAEETAQKIRTRFTHEGYFLGVLPIYFNEANGEVLGKHAVYDWLVFPIGHLWGIITFGKWGWPMMLREIEK